MKKSHKILINSFYNFLKRKLWQLKINRISSTTYFTNQKEITLGIGSEKVKSRKVRDLLHYLFQYNVEDMRNKMITK